MLIFSIKALLLDDVLYTEETYTSEWLLWLRVIGNNTEYSQGDDNAATITISFSYTPGGNDNMLNTGLC